MDDDICKKVQDALNSVNEQQENLRRQKQYIPPQFVAHATHISQEEFRISVPEVFTGVSSKTEIVPAFSKATQNELNAFKNLLSTLNTKEIEQLKINLPKSPKRVFAISTKQDDKGNPIFDENGVPIPQDGSYAYSLKKCSASICFVDEGIPLLIGFREKYADFENGEKTGHIYIGKGSAFKSEYDNNGNITEFTSTDNMQVIFHMQTTPREAMQHNVQFVMFGNAEDYEKWSEKVRKKEENFETFVSSNSYKITSLQEEILTGRATFINATANGCNPKISGLTRATAKYCELMTLNRIRM
ncbi:hypothetical protein IJ556_00480 [bacterium]|nr:hypothetical protein [bacterium]MBR2273479.1 hypothetical protein [Alphaproteobacteria bacterium]